MHRVANKIKNHFRATTKRRHNQPKDISTWMQDTSFSTRILFIYECRERGENEKRELCDSWQQTTPKRGKKKKKELGVGS